MRQGRWRRWGRLEILHIITHIPCVIMWRLKMTNLTLAIDDQLLGRVRDYATRRGTTVNAIVREYFENLARNEDRLADALRELREMSEKSEARLGPNYRFSREETYAERMFPRHEHTDLRRRRSKG